MRLSPNSSAAAGPRERELNSMSVRGKVLVLICLLLCSFSLPFSEFLAQEKGGTMPLQITSAAFSAGETIPKKFTCDGPDVSPKLTWNEPPAKTQSFRQNRIRRTMPAAGQAASLFLQTLRPRFEAESESGSHQSRRRTRHEGPRPRASRACRPLRPLD